MCVNSVLIRIVIGAIVLHLYNNSFGIIVIGIVNVLFSILNLSKLKYYHRYSYIKLNYSINLKDKFYIFINKFRIYFSTKENISIGVYKSQSIIKLSDISNYYLQEFKICYYLTLLNVFLYIIK